MGNLMYNKMIIINFLKKHVNKSIKHINNKSTTYNNNLSLLNEIIKIVYLPIFETFIIYGHTILSKLYKVCLLITDFLIKLIYKTLIIFCSILKTDIKQLFNISLNKLF